MNMGKKWKAWKNRVRDKFFDPNMSLEENLNKRPDSEDERVLPNQWKILVIHWNSDAAREESDRNKATRAKKRYNHITGKKSFAQVKEEMKRDARELVRETRDSKEREGAENDVDLMDYEPSRVDLYGECYTKKGSTSNLVIADTWARMR